MRRRPTLFAPHARASRAARSAAATLALLLSVTASAAALDVPAEIVAPAQNYLGSGYCFGSASPDCFDCSGFVNYIYRPHVPDLPRSSRAMARFGEAVRVAEVRPGDLLFFTTGPDPNVISHVAIYIGQDTIIHAVSDGPERGVTMTPLSARYWSRRVHSARRVLALAPPETADSTAAEPAADPAASSDTLRFAKGTYRGELRDGEPHGAGVLRMTNGDRYEGEFRDGLFHGSGTYTWADGRSYTGRFTDGAIAESGARHTYFEERSSPWNDFDGVVRGDFDAWWEDEQNAFEQWKQEQENY
ncbi:MAG: NlpC/P60 family protein [Spirochaetaceae bacterium]